MELWKQLRATWEAFGLEVKPGADAATIRQFEHHRDVILPSDMRSYFECADGMDGHICDDLLNTFYPLRKIKPISEILDEYHPERMKHLNGFVFGDHSISCYLYAVRIVRETDVAGPVFRTDGIISEPVAESFSDFFRMYLADPASILWR